MKAFTVTITRIDRLLFLVNGKAYTLLPMFRMYLCELLPDDNTNVKFILNSSDKRAIPFKFVRNDSWVDIFKSGCNHMFVDICYMHFNKLTNITLNQDEPTIINVKITKVK